MMHRPRHSDAAAGRRGNLDRLRAIGTRLLRFARNDVFGAALMLLSLAIAGPAQAVRPDEMLPDPALEARAR
jgi:hypothetical protein